MQHLITLPETNIAPENRPSQKGINSSSNHPFLGAMLVLGMVYKQYETSPKRFFEVITSDTFSNFSDNFLASGKKKTPLWSLSVGRRVSSTAPFFEPAEKYDDGAKCM